MGLAEHYLLVAGFWFALFCHCLPLDLSGHHVPFQEELWGFLHGSTLASESGILPGPLRLSPGLVWLDLEREHLVLYRWLSQQDTSLELPGLQQEEPAWELSHLQGKQSREMEGRGTTPMTLSPEPIQSFQTFPLLLSRCKSAWLVWGGSPVTTAKKTVTDALSSDAEISLLGICLKENSLRSIQMCVHSDGC